MIKYCLVAALAATWAQIVVAQPRVEPVGSLPDRWKPALVATVSRVEPATEATGTAFRYQWPGTYFETAFKGNSAFFRVGPGDVHLHVLVDGKSIASLVKPSAGFYEVKGLGNKTHRVRIEAVSESQAAANEFGGFYLPKRVKAVPIKPHPRQIEFIGDSHTVGYGNSSDRRECTQEEVWSTTDNSQAFGPIIAKRFDADYQVNAISGRGIVRNYHGGSGETLPEAYPFILFDRAHTYDAANWTPQWIVISLGTNDFSTELHEAEPWKSRDELHAAFEARFVRFVQELRTKNPQAQLLLWATDGVNTEIRDEVQKVVAQLRDAGETNIGFIPISGLSMSGCHWHPSAADDQVIANALIAYMEAHADGWGDR
jgi:lysophospholipase L1-like esterase